MTRSKTVSDEHVLEAARRVFLREGIRAPVSAVAKELGLSVATVFFRTKSKDELLFRALRPPPPAAIELLNRGPQANRDPRSELLEILLLLCGFFLEAVPSLFLLATAGLFRRFERGLDPPKELRLAMTRWFRRAQTRGLHVKSPQVVSELLISSLEARYTRAYVRGEKYSPAQNKEYLDRILDQLIEVSQGKSRGVSRD